MYSLDFRKHVLKVGEREGLSIRKLAKRFSISSSTLINWRRRLAPKTKRHKPALKIDMEALKKDIDQYPDAYQYERAERFGVSKSGIWHAMKRLGVSYKKKR